VDPLRYFHHLTGRQPLVRPLDPTGILYTTFDRPFVIRQAAHG